MNISIKILQTNSLSQEARHIVEAKLAPIARLLGDDKETALLEVELQSAPPEGRSATPVRLAANLSIGNTVLHAEAVKPTPESAADRVRNSLEAEVRRVRGKKRSMLRRSADRVKRLIRFGR